MTARAPDIANTGSAQAQAHLANNRKRKSGGDRREESLLFALAMFVTIYSW